MSTKIEWCQIPGTKAEVWNVVTGCNKVSEGCKNCYAEVMHNRLRAMLPVKYNHAFLGGAYFHESLINIPFKWKTPRTVFVNSMSDLFEDNIDFFQIRKVMDTIYHLQMHTFIILTKRPKRMLEFFEWLGNNNLAKNFPNMWLGVSVENQQTANDRIPSLIKIPCKVRFLSCEPLLGEINLKCIDPVFNKNTGSVNNFIDCLKSHPIGSPLKPFIDWVIVGGESGRKARPMHPEWVRRLLDQCQEAAIPFFFKQWGEWFPDRQFTTLKEVVEDDTIHKQEVQMVRMNGLHDYRILVDGITEPVYRMVKVGKKKAGNTIDGKPYLEFPKL